MADKKQNGLIVNKVSKHAQEKQNESLSQTCIITFYSEGGCAPFNIFRAAAREKWVTFRVKKVFFSREKQIKLK